MQAETLQVGTAAATARNVWERIKTHLAARITPQAFENWVLRTEFQSQQDGFLRVLVPDQVTKDFLEQEYGEDVRNSIRDLNLPIRHIVYLAGAAALAEVNPVSAAVSETYGEPVFASTAGSLNPKFRFDNFVVGSCNEFAHAAAKAVSNHPSRSYNPLFIYGGVGMGKTHLMHAIGRALLDQYAGMRIVYTSSERFMNEMVACLRTNRMPSFHRHYRSADVQRTHAGGVLPHLQ